MSRTLCKILGVLAAVAVAVGVFLLIRSASKAKVTPTTTASAPAGLPGGPASVTPGPQTGPAAPPPTASRAPGAPMAPSSVQSAPPAGAGGDPRAQMRAWVQSSLDSLGVQLQLPIPEDRRGAGITIAGTRPGSPAQKGGFRAGDMIASFGGTPVTTPLDLASLIAAAKPGTRYPIGVQRGGKSVTLQVSGVAPSKLARPTMPSMPAGPTLQPGR